MRKTLGIIGGGQLALMIIASASKFGIDCICLDPNENAPAFKYCRKSICGEFNDPQALNQLVNQSDKVVYEFENVDLNALKQVDTSKLTQGIDVLMYSQNRLREKRMANEAGLKTCKYAKVNSYLQLLEATEIIGYPAILKTTELGYDGHGQLVLKSVADLHKAKELLDVECILEQMVKFDYEVSIIACRNHEGSIETFPLFRNEHRNGILHRTDMNEQIDSHLQEKAENLIRRLMEKQEFYGILCIEFFVVGNELYFNEMAPRPHNSGHITMDACNVSQFDNLVRSAFDLKLVKPRILSDGTMLQILGQHLNNAYDLLQSNSDCLVYDYGKEDAKTNRKMGHLNLIGLDEESIKKIEEVLIHE